MSTNFVDKTNALLARTPPAPGTEWADLARDLRPEHFDFVLSLLDRQQPSTANALQLAYQNFTLRDPSFRTFLAQAVIRREDVRFRAGVSTFANRMALRALADSVTHQTDADTDLIAALAYHRAYQETVPGSSVVGNDVRRQLRQQVALILQPTGPVPVPSFRFVPAFRFILRDTDKPTTPVVPDWDDRAFLLETLQHLTDPQTRAALDWQVGAPLERQALYLLADTLAFVVNDPYPYGDEVRSSVKNALLQTVERAVQIWSASYHAWDPLSPASVEREACLRAESFLHGLIARLETLNGKGFFGPQAVEQYRRWVELCGGFERAACDAFLQQPIPLPPAPAPFFQRNWLRAEDQGRNTLLLFAVGPYQFVRHFDLLRKPVTGDRFNTPDLTSSLSEKWVGIGAESGESR